MKKIFKYDIPVSKEPLVLSLPAYYKVRYIGLQKGQPKMWAEINPAMPNIEHTFQWFGTGHEIADNCLYKGTLLLYDDELVVHLYEMNVNEMGV